MRYPQYSISCDCCQPPKKFSKYRSFATHKYNKKIKLSLENNKCNDTKADKSSAKNYIEANIVRFAEMVKYNGLSSELLSNDFKQFPGYFTIFIVHNNIIITF
jgi:hypothetical protein